MKFDLRCRSLYNDLNGFRTPFFVHQRYGLAMNPAERRLGKRMRSLINPIREKHNERDKDFFGNAYCFRNFIS